MFSAYNKRISKNENAIRNSISDKPNGIGEMDKTHSKCDRFDGVL